MKRECGGGAGLIEMKEKVTRKLENWKGRERMLLNRIRNNKDANVPSNFIIEGITWILLYSFQTNFSSYSKLTLTIRTSVFRKNNGMIDRHWMKLN